MDKNEYTQIIVESYIPKKLSGKRGRIHVRPCANQGLFLPEMGVECSKKLMEDYPVGTKFEIKAKITSRKGSAPFVYSNYNWAYKVLSD